MSHAGIKQLVGAALVDRDVFEGLKNGKRSALLAGFDLTDEEREMLDSLEAGSVQDLADSLHGWLMEQSEPATLRVDRNPVQAL
ncbi:MAG: hypothetical protein PVJ55_01865 [Anaerolineae bacterium]|jgi:hypothetical protein